MKFGKFEIDKEIIATICFTITVIVYLITR